MNESEQNELNESEKNEPGQEGTEPQETVPDRIIGGSPPTRTEPQDPASLDAPRRWWQLWRR
jgi:hypothetical protein